MNTSIRIRAALLLLLAALGGCSTVQPVASTAKRLVEAILPGSPSTPSPAGPLDAPVPPPSRTLDAYKAEVAQHVMRHNSGQTFSGRLPPMLPAIVVLNITVRDDGELEEVKVQRSRDDDASQVALASMRRSGPLPKPVHLLAGSSRKLTFSETFLFNDQYRFQLRSLAGPQ
ncbi:MAG: hypothetical protein AB1807_21065 [Pseudomonadota bacterium]